MSSSSSAPKTVFVRDSSPAAFAYASAGLGEPSLKQKRVTAEHAISTADSMSSLIETIPTRYRKPFATILRDIQKNHGRFCSASKFLGDLRSHQDKGTTPSVLAGMHNPFSSLQVTDVSRPVLSSSLSEANSWFKQQKEAALAKAIELKEAEVAHLKTLCAPLHAVESMKQAVSSDWAALRKALGIHVEESTHPETGKKIGVDPPKFCYEERDLVLSLLPAWATKAWDFTRISSQRLQEELEKKQKLAASAADKMDYEMTGNPSLEKTVQKAVADALRKQNKPPGSMRGGKGKGRPQTGKVPPRPGQQSKPKPKGLKASAAPKKTITKRKRNVSGAGSGPSQKKGKQRN